MLQSNSYDGAGDKSGLYMITDTNSGNPTYYFRPNNSKYDTKNKRDIWKKTFDFKGNIAFSKL